MVNKLATLDTIVATNPHADLLSILAAVLAGCLASRPASTPSGRYPSIFEPIHGSAFDIMGEGPANPAGTFWSVVMMLEHLGEPEAARRLPCPGRHARSNHSPALEQHPLTSRARPIGVNLVAYGCPPVI